MRDSRKRSDRCEGSNLSNMPNDMDSLTGRIDCTRSADNSITGLSVTRSSFIESFTKADESVNKMRCQNEKRHEYKLNQLTCDNYATSLMLHPTILLTRKSERVCRCCNNCTEKQLSTRISETSSTDISESNSNEKRHRRTLHSRHKTPNWVKATALLFIIFLSSCNALPTNRGSRLTSAASSATDFENDDSTVLSNSTGRSRNGRSSDLTQHMRVQKLYNNYYGVYLELKGDGRVGGTRKGNSPYTDIIFKPVGRGRMALYFVESRKYLAVRRRKLEGVDDYTEECCTFKEMYNPRDKLHFTYELASVKPKKGRKRRRYVAIKVKKRRSKKGKALTIAKLNRFAFFQKLSSKRP